MAAAKVIDLFSGAGGFTLGAIWAGFDVTLCIDNDDDLTSTHDINFPGVPVEDRDLSKLDAEKVPKLAGISREKIIGIIGGPPCQGFSEIGKRDSNDDRNTLVERYFYYVRALRPSFFVMENVPGLLHEHGRARLENGLQKLPDDYEVFKPNILNATKYGLPTSRNRVFVIGYLPKQVSSLTWDDLEPSETREVTVHDALHDLPSPADAERIGTYSWGMYDGNQEPESEYAQALREPPDAYLSTEDIREKLNAGKVSGFMGTNHTERVVERFSDVNQGERDEVSKCPRLKWTDQCGTLRAGTGSDRGAYQAIRPIHPDEDRVITVREAARLQGFPDWFQFDDTKWHSFRMIGNSVPPVLAHFILARIREQITVEPHRR